MGTGVLSASWQGLLQNLAILAILVSVWTHGVDRIDGKARWYREAFGIGLSAAGVILLMQVPLEIRPGIFVNLRGALIALAGFFGSPLIGVAAGLTAAAYRIHLGGSGTAGGVVSIVACAAVGIGGHFIRRGRVATMRDVLGFAVATSLAVPIGFLVLPAAIRLQTLVEGGPVTAIMTFMATMVAGLALVDADRRREVSQANLFYRAIIDSLPEPVNAKDLDGHFLAANPATARQLGAADVAAVIGKTDFDFHAQDVARGFRADEERVLAAGEPEIVEQEVLRKDGTRVWSSSLKFPLRNRDGTIIGLLTHNHDVTERKRLENEIAEGRRRLSEAMEAMADGLAMFDKEARLVLCNEQYRTMFPLTAEMRVPGAWLADILRASVERGEQTDVAPGAIDAWLEHILANFTQPGETDIQMGDGRWLRARVRPTADGGSLTLMTDVTQIKQAEATLTDVNQRLMNLASEDGLTGLSNRRAYDVALRRAFAQSRRSGMPLSLLIIDVDHFKAYNDTYGHPAGDTCLRTIGNLLRMTLRRPSDLAARYGGEEFAAILPNTPEEGAMLLAEALRKSILGLGMEHTGTKLGAVTASVGVATMTADSTISGPDELMAAADSALYAAKAGGRNRTVCAEQTPPLAAAG